MILLPKNLWKGRKSSPTQNLYRRRFKQQKIQRKTTSINYHLKSVLSKRDSIKNRLNIRVTPVAQTVFKGYRYKILTFILRGSSRKICLLNTIKPAIWISKADLRNHRWRWACQILTKAIKIRWCRLMSSSKLTCRSQTAKSSVAKAKSQMFTVIGSKKKRATKAEGRNSNKL